MKHEIGERGRESEKEEGHGGMKGHPAVAQIAKKHGVSTEEIVAQVKKGYKVESEHTNDIDMAIDIALQHVNEFPNYYDELDKMEKKLKINEGPIEDIVNTIKKPIDAVKNVVNATNQRNQDLVDKINQVTPGSASMPAWKKFKTEDHVAIAMGKMLDSEGAMIKNQLETIERSVALLRAQIKDDDMQIPAWVQAKVTLATENILTCANYMSGRGEEVSEMIQLPAAAATALSVYSKVTTGLNALKKTATANQQPDGKETTAVTNQPQTAASSSSSKQSTQVPSTDSKNTTIDPKTGKRIVRGIEKAVSNTAGMAKQGVGGYVSMFKPEEVSHDSQRLSSFSQFRQNSSNCQLDEKEIENNVIDETIHEVAAWQRKEGKNQKGGLNEKGRKSYERENPGSDLKAPQPEGGSRRNSFCARMKGMKAKLTSAKTARDPDSRINKSLRAWNC
jgi:hypothetical protein